MEREVYIRHHLQQLQNYWLNINLILGAIVFLLLGLMDYFAAPAQFARFFVSRTGIAVALLLFLVLNKTINRAVIRTWTINTIMLLGTAFSSITIELMILDLGGHRSSYYAGLNLLAVFALTFIPLDVPMAAACVSTIYFIYLVPILIWDTISDPRIFVVHNAFLIATSIVALAWRALSQRDLKKNLGLQFDLDSERRQLQMYSDRLAGLVDEKTRDLNKSEKRYRSLFEYANDGIVIMNSDGLILDVNQKACLIHGFDRDSLIGANLGLLETEDNKMLLRERLERIVRGESLLFETQHYRKDGGKVDVEVSATALEIEGQRLIQAFHRDITEKKKIQEHLLQSQKMDSIGLLAGGIAHDFNNILTGILGNTELILDDESLADSVTGKVRQIESSALQAAAMVSKLLKFARRESFEARVFNFNNLIQEAVGILERLIPKHISLRIDMAENLPVVKGDITQLEQVIMNLVLNARDAMPNGGEVFIKTGTIEIGPGGSPALHDAAGGRYVTMSVADTGCGIPESQLARIFEPFFTTKEKGKGTGLGLAMVYGIVRDHHGYITVKSVVNLGTTFTIYLPVAERTVLTVDDESRTQIEGGKTILVVDDEIPVLTYVKEALQKRGFNVIITDNPLSALNIYRQEHQRIDLIITDLIMPIMEGSHLIRSLRQINPRAPILAMSGFNENPDKELTGPVLKKPFSAVNLLVSMKHAMDGPASPRDN